MNSQLPKDWKWMKLGEVCNIHQGYGFPKNLQGLKSGKYPFYKVGDISKNVKAGYRYLEFCDNFIDEKTLHQLKAKSYPVNTIVFAKIGEALKLNRRAIIRKSGIVDNNAIGLKAIDRYCTDLFLFHFFTTVKLEDYSRATTVPSVRKSDIEEIQIPLPPKLIQQAIVSKIEELFSEIEKGIESLFTARQQLKTYRQSVLKWAFEGKLTEEWRKDTRVRIPAAPLEGNMAAEPEMEYVIQKNHSLDKEELPEGWKIETLGNLSDMRLGKMLDKNKNKGNYHFYLRNISVRWGNFDLRNLEQMRFEENEEEQYELKKGDLVICEGGEPGRCAIWKEQIPKMKIQKALHRVRTKKSLSTSYLYNFIYYSSMIGSLEKYFTGTTIKHLTGTQLKNVSIPLPPIEEQNKIVDAIESRLSVADKMEESINQSLQQAEALRQSILKTAFEGKLVIEEGKEEIIEVKSIIKKGKTKIIKLPEQEFPRRKTAISETDLHAGIIGMIIEAHEANPRHAAKLNHVKCEKIADQVERNLGISLGRKAVKDAAGPDDYPHLKKVEHRANMAGYFSTVSLLPIGHTYKPQRNLHTIINKTKEALTIEELGEVKKLIQAFLPFELEHAELIATIFAGWNNLLIEGLNPSDEEIVYESRENWSKRKLSIEREKFFKALSWMREHDFVPKGKGVVVPFPIKKVNKKKPPKCSR